VRYPPPFSAFLTPANPVNGWLWGVGPVVQVPTISDASLGANAATEIRADMATTNSGHIHHLIRHSPNRLARRRQMLPVKSTLICLAVCAVASACAAQVQNKENMLAAAGFTLVPANTPQRQASLSALPPHKFVHQVRNNAVIYTYADPTICDCLYVGNQAAYDRYRQDVFVKHIADEQQMTAQINEMNWGPWGPGWYY
jgi:hypothetical protein